MSRQYPILILKKFFSRNTPPEYTHTSSPIAQLPHTPTPACRPTQLANAAANSTSADNTINNPIDNTTIITLLLLDRLIIQQTYILLHVGQSLTSAWRGAKRRIYHNNSPTQKDRAQVHTRTRDTLPKHPCKKDKNFLTPIGSHGIITV